MGDGNDGMFEGSFSGGSVSADMTLGDGIKLQLGDAPDYWLSYIQGSTKFCLSTTNGDGAGADTNFLCVVDGTDDLVLTGGASLAGALDMNENQIIIDNDANSYMTAGSDALTITLAGASAALFASSGITLYKTTDLRGNHIYSSTQHLELGSNASTDHSLTTGDVVAGAALEVQGTLYAGSIGAHGTAHMYDVSDPYAGTVNIDAAGASSDCSAAAGWVLISDATDCVAGDLHGFTRSNCVLTASFAHDAAVRLSISFDGQAGDDIFIGVAANGSLPPSPKCQTRRDASATGAAGAASATCTIAIGASQTLSAYYCNGTLVTRDINVTRFTLDSVYAGD